MADFTSGLAIIDISDPLNPGIPVYRDTVGDARGVAVSGSFAYVADGASGFAIIDLTGGSDDGRTIYSRCNEGCSAIVFSGEEERLCRMGENRHNSCPIS